MAGRKLKVFKAQFGFYDTIVAAPSRAAALRAWGTHQDLFASGDAKVVTEEGAVAAATAHPEVPLRRAIGSKDPFALEPTGVPKVPGAPKRRVDKSESPGKIARPPRPAPRPDRSTLDTAEKALRALDDRRKTEEADFRREQHDLEGRIAAARGAYVEGRKATAAKVVAARIAYRKAGGRD